MNLLTFELLRKRAAAGGGGGPAPYPTGCAYPLDAPELEIQGLGATGRLTMSNADQTGSMTVPAPGSTEIYMAFPTGLLASTAAALDLTADTGVKVVEFVLDVPAAADTAIGGGTAYGYSGMAGLFAAGPAPGIGITISAGNHGLSKITVSIGGTDVSTVNGVTITGAVLFGAEFDTGAGTVEITRDGTPIVLSSNTFTPGEFVPFIQCVAESTRVVEDQGKVCAVTLRTDAASMTGTYSTGATDTCGNAI